MSFFSSSSSSSLVVLRVKTVLAGTLPIARGRPRFPMPTLLPELLGAALDALYGDRHLEQAEQPEQAEDTQLCVDHLVRVRAKVRVRVRLGLG